MTKTKYPNDTDDVILFILDLNQRNVSWQMELLQHMNKWYHRLDKKELDKLRHDLNTGVHSMDRDILEEVISRRLYKEIRSINEPLNDIAEKIQKKLRQYISRIESNIKEVVKNTGVNDKESRNRNSIENLVMKASYWLPRKYREAIVGDIIEDINEIRALGKSEWRIRIHVVWQVVIALILLRPTAIMDAFKRIWSTK